MTTLSPTPAGNAPEAMFSLVLDTALTSGLTLSVAAHLLRAGFPLVIPA
jgi:hypothetical protein